MRAVFAKGFTLVELLLVMGLISVLASFAVVNIIRPQTRASIDTTVTTIAADLKSQQLKAMAGGTESAGTSQPYGIYFESDQYTLFKGTVYSAEDSDNFIISLDDEIDLQTSFPGAYVIFLRNSGEVEGFDEGLDEITISSEGESRTINVNRYGALLIN